MILTVFKQVVIMLILSGVGYIMFRTGKITNEGSKTLGNILIFLSLPCVIINGFLTERTPDKIAGLLLSAVLALVVLLLSMLLSRLFCGRHALDNFAGSFSNPGFFGVPIILAVFGNEAVFFIAAFIAFLNLLQWTYGVGLLKKSDENGLIAQNTASTADNQVSFGRQMLNILKNLVKAPFMIAILIGCFFFFTAVPMPELVGKCINHIAGVNTPLAMFTIGIYAAQTDLLTMFRHGRLYLVSLIKLLLIPAASLLLFSLLPIGSTELKTCILIAAACPVGSNIAVYAQLHNKDYRYAVETVVMSTLLSILTLPCIVALANMVWQ